MSQCSLSVQLLLQVFLLLLLSVLPGESDHVSYMTDKSSCSICKVKSFLGSSLCRAPYSRIYPCLCFLSWFHHYPIWYHLCLPSFIQFLVTLVISWRIYFLPHHNMVSHQHFLKTKTSHFDDGTLGFTFIIGEFLFFSCQLSPIDWKSVESFPCSTSTHLFTWP